MKQAIFIGLILITLLLSGCVEQEPATPSGQNGQQTTENTYAGNEFSIECPANWSKVTDTPAGAIFAPSDEMSVLMVSKITGIEGKEINSLDQLVEQLLSPLKETGTFIQINETATTLDGVQAKDITFSFEEKGELIKTRIITAEKNNEYYLLSLTGSEPQFNRDLPIVEQAIKSFKFK